MTVYVHESGERKRPKPGGSEEERVKADPKWSPEGKPKGETKKATGTASVAGGAAGGES